MDSQRTNQPVVGKDAEPELISVIIPTLNEERYLAPTIVRAKTDPNIELIVADGGSQDDTPRLAHDLGAQVILSKRGRALQMNNGAAHATGPYLLFLHADTHLPDEYGSHIRSILANQACACGAYLHTYDLKTPWHRFISVTVNLRSRIFGLPYGDQAIFLRRATFEQLVGYRDLPILEELDLLRRARKLGAVRLAPARVTTSARRGRSQGELRTTLANDILLLGHALRVRPEKLHPIYRWVAGLSTPSIKRNDPKEEQIGRTGLRS